LGAEQLDHLAASAAQRSLRGGDVVVRQGETGDSMFIVTSGQVRVVSDVPSERVLLAHLGPGEFFGKFPCSPVRREARPWWRRSRRTSSK
jgi:CRP-like cAMP-binding protein